jgi:alpha-methylacyl-CoA racemase
LVLFNLGLGLEGNDDVSRELLESTFRTKTQQEWVDIFKDLDACVSPVLSLDEATGHAHNQERGSFIRTSDKSKWLPTMNWLDKESCQGNLEDPDIGQHTSVILSQLGYSRSDIDRFLADNIVEQAAPKSKL